LRVQQGNNIARVFYFHYQSNFYLLTSGFIKKKNKTDMKEIEKAEKIMKLFLGEKGNA
jgi:phage-related protein